MIPTSNPRLNWNDYIPDSLWRLHPDLISRSWGGDACPSVGVLSFERSTAGQLIDLRLWVEHPDPDARQTTGNRFEVNATPDSSVAWEVCKALGWLESPPGIFVVYSGDDQGEAAAMLGWAAEKLQELLGQ